MTWMPRLVVLFPVLAALIGLLVRRSRTLARMVAVAGALGATGAAIAEWASAPDPGQAVDTVGRLPIPGFEINLRLIYDNPAGITATVVTFVTLMIQLFTVWYLADDDRYEQFAASVSLFASGMLLVVQSNDILLSLVGWEVMGWCSYLLIGHFSRKESARRAAYKAFMVTRFADVGFVLGVGWFIATTRSSDLTLIAEHFEGQHSWALTLGLVGLLAGIAGKSGLIPFHDWLPDAMEGPTPASALIHAATMVAAGTYLLFRLFPLYAEDSSFRLIVAILCGATMMWAGFLAFGQVDVKRLLAYSTLSQVAIMASANAVAEAESPAGPALGHLWSHAFFKALLFLGAGWLSVLVGGTAFGVVRGGLRKDTWLKIFMAIGLLSLAGVPPLVGFFSKDAVIGLAEEDAFKAGHLPGWIVFISLMVTVLLTAAYCTRAWLLLSRGEPTEHGEAHGHGHAPSSTHPPLAAGPVGVLALLTVVGAVLLLKMPGGLHIAPVTAVISIVLILGAAAAIWSRSHQGEADPAELLLGKPGMERFSAGFGMDKVYVAFGQFILKLARLTAFLDREVVDAYPRAGAITFRAASDLGHKAHRAVPSTGLVGVVLGVVALGVLGVTLWH